ncbi:uncharacterized protein LOC121376538 [Gigantopelta aegis]|uniref:uncharacterized protein LOC121376538 n=1 Tax=Gigantopelta aegis TaxID=1735272 RepID=UPI001B8898EC|nr:uncharacterized protein LOC121376538 [Gigantopelta aegis]
MHFTSLLIVATAACVTVASRVYTRDEIFRIVSAGIPRPGYYHAKPGYHHAKPGYQRYGPVNTHAKFNQRYRPAPRNTYYAGAKPPYRTGGYYNPKQSIRYQSCKQDDPSAKYELSSDVSNYPGEAVIGELGRQEQLYRILNTMKVHRTYHGYTKILDLSTCKTKFATLASFYNPDYGTGRCWVLPDYQEKVEFAICKHGTCNNSCYKSDLPGLKAICAKNFRHVSVWAYCENTYGGNPIVYTRLVIPAFCSCKHLQC